MIAHGNAQGMRETQRHVSLGNCLAHLDLESRDYSASCFKHRVGGITCKQCTICFPYRPATRPPMACNTGRASIILCFKNSISKTVKQEKSGEKHALSALFSTSNAQLQSLPSIGHFSPGVALPSHSHLNLLCIADCFIIDICLRKSFEAANQMQPGDGPSVLSCPRN